MNVYDFDGVQCVVVEEPEGFGSIAMFSFEGKSLTLPLHANGAEWMATECNYIVVLLENGTTNHYRLANVQGGVTYGYDGLPTMSLKTALAWKARFEKDQAMLAKWSFKAIMPVNAGTLDWLRSYMPRKRSKIDNSTRLLVYRKCGGRCAYCGKRIDVSEMQVDHVESHYRHQGKDELDNYLPSCRDCNGLKSDYTLDEFRNVLIPRCAKRGRMSGRKDTRSARIAAAYGLDLNPRKRIVFWFEKEGNGKK